MQDNKKIREIIREAIEGLSEEQSQERVHQLGKNRFVINGNEIDYLYLWNIHPTDWESTLISRPESLLFLFEGKYHAFEIIIKNLMVSSFVGRWKDGDFNGNEFGISQQFKIPLSELSFDGGRFIKGLFDLPYFCWNTSPTNFIDGRISKTSDGLLGLKNKDSGIIEESTHLIQIPSGRYILIKQEGDSTIYPIEVIKRMDELNSDFEFKNILDNRTSRVKWSIIREKFNNLFLKKGRKNFSIPGVISLNGMIESIEIVDDISKISKKQSSQLKKKEYKSNLKNIPSIFGDLTTVFDVSQIRKEAETNPNLLPRIKYIFDDINKNNGEQFLKHLKNIFDEVSLTRQKINRKDIGGIRYINSIMDSILNEQVDSGVMDSLRYFNDFVLFIKKYASNSDEILKKLEDYISEKSKELKLFTSPSDSSKKTTEIPIGRSILNPEGGLNK